MASFVRQRPRPENGSVAGRASGSATGDPRGFADAPDTFSSKRWTVGLVPASRLVPLPIRGILWKPRFSTSSTVQDTVARPGLHQPLTTRKEGRSFVTRRLLIAGLPEGSQTQQRQEALIQPAGFLLHGESPVSRCCLPCLAKEMDCVIIYLQTDKVDAWRGKNSSRQLLGRRRWSAKSPRSN